MHFIKERQYHKIKEHANSIKLEAGTELEKSKRRFLPPSSSLIIIIIIIIITTPTAAPRKGPSRCPWSL